MSLPSLDEATLEDLYKWLDEIPSSRPRKCITRDFSDGVLVAELVHHFLPRLVDLHNYAPVNSMVEKRYNWSTLNRKVLSKLGFQLPNHIIQQVVAGRPGAVEYVLSNLRYKIDLALCQQQNNVYHRSASASRNSSMSSLEDPAMASHGSLATAIQRLQSVSAANSPRTPRKAMVKNFNPKSSPGSGTCAPEELASARCLYESRQQILAKDEQIQVLQARITHLERLVELKDDRIRDLSQRLDRLAQELFHQHNLDWNGMVHNLSDS